MANFLRLETSDRLLLEAGDGLLLEDQAGAANTGAAAVTLDAAIVAGTAGLAVKGNASVVFGGVSTAAIGTAVVQATGPVGLAPVTATARGTLALRGSTAVSLAATAVAATGGQGGTAAALIGLADAGLAATAMISGAATTSPSGQRGGGWSAHEFARLRHNLARKKKRLHQVAAATLESLPLDDRNADAIVSIVRRIEAAMAQLQAATTMAALRDVQGRLYAARASIEAEIDDEDILLLTA